MCEPVTGTITMASVAAWGSAAATASSLVMEQQKSDAQSAANARQVANTKQAQADNSNQITLQRTQQTDAASGKINANNQAMREAQASVVASAGPSGLYRRLRLGDTSKLSLMGSRLSIR